MRAAPSAVRWAGLLTAAGLLLAGSVVTAVEAWGRERSVATGPTWRDVGVAAALLVLVGVLAAAVWCRREARDGAGAALLVAVSAALLPWWSTSDWVPPGLVTPALAAGPVILLALAGLAREWATPPARTAWLVLGVLGATASVLYLVLYDPAADPRCVRRCAAGLDLVDGARLRWLLEGGWLLAAVLLSLAVLVRAAGLPNPVRAGLATGAVGLLLVAVVAADRGPSLGGGRERLVLLVPVAAATFGVGVHAVDLARRRRHLRRLVTMAQVGSGEHGPGSGFLAFRAGDGVWVDAEGAEVHLDGSTAAPVLWEGGSVAVVRVAAGATTGQDRSGAVPPRASADEIVLRNLWGLALVRMRRRELVRSRRRIVEVGDEERRRIERDLHDGVQQRLVSAQLHLALARGRLDSSGAQELTAAEDHIGQALHRLRALCHGTFPRVLATEGLAEALHDLVDRHDLRARVQVEADVGHLDPAQASALYAVAATTLGDLQDGGDRGSIELTEQSSALRMTVRLPGGGGRSAPGWAEDLVDRVGAVGGSLLVSEGPEGLRVEVVVPCASS